ncbi:MAG TPA: hypothetical protein VI248_25180 [Kineosporiaceae bacterium]
MSQPTAGSREPRTHRHVPRRVEPALRAVRPSAAAPLLLVTGAAAGAFSVPRYDVRVVLIYLALLAVLAVAVARGLRRPLPRSPLTRRAGTVALLGAALLVWSVPAFTYVPGSTALVLRSVTAGGCLLAAVLVTLPYRPATDAALAVAAATYAATAAAALRLDPAPRIDVWYTLQGAADGLLHGADMYRQVWVGPPGPMPFFTYLPWTAVLLAPGRWLVGDVRWALVVITMGTVVTIRWLHLPLASIIDRGTPPPDRTPPTTHPRPAGEPGATGRAVPDPHGEQVSAALAATLLLLLPGTLTQVEQAWTEPLLLGCLALTTLGLIRRNGLLAVVGLAVALACKQHVVLLLPLFAAWPRFGGRRAAAAAALAGVLVLPWVAADPGAMWHDTVTLLVNFPALRFADTAYVAVLNTWQVQPPFWLTGAVVLATVAAATLVVRRHNPTPAGMLRWCAVVLFAANLVNKQAFYNQYWLVAGLVLLSWAAPSAPPAGATTDEPRQRPARTGTTAAQASPTR